MRVPQLKIKIATLAAESRIIRREERKHLTAARIGKVRLQLQEAGLSEAARDRIIRRAYKTLGRRETMADNATKYGATPAVSKALRAGPSDKTLDIWHTYWDLRAHRLGLRSESRTSQLAYALLRDVPYSRVERPVRTAPNWEAIASTAKRFGASEQTITSWIDGAKEMAEESLPKKAA